MTRPAVVQVDACTIRPGDLISHHGQQLVVIDRHDHRDGLDLTCSLGRGDQTTISLRPRAVITRYTGTRPDSHWTGPGGCMPGLNLAGARRLAAERIRAHHAPHPVEVEASVVRCPMGDQCPDARYSEWRAA